MEKATHFGTCQVCGHLQKAPGNKMAKHGYTVQWSFFEGVCWGADELPFELDKAVAHKAHDSQQKSIDAHYARIAELNGPLVIRTEPGFEAIYTIWKNEYVKNERTGKSDYEWLQVDVRVIRHDYSDNTGFYLTADYRAKADGPWRRWDTYGSHVKTENGFVRELLVPRIKMHENYIRQLNSYRDWQAKRIAAWKVEPMKPVADEAAKLTHIIFVQPKPGSITDGQDRYVSATYGRGGWSGDASFDTTTNRSKAKRFTERGANMAIGKLRRWGRMKAIPA